MFLTAHLYSTLKVRYVVLKRKCANKQCFSRKDASLFTVHVDFWCPNLHKKHPRLKTINKGETEVETRAVVIEANVRTCSIQIQTD